MNYRERLLRSIPGGAHTYSRGYDQYPSNVPEILKRGKGCYVYDDQDRPFLDYGMALRAVGIGYAEERINQAAIQQIENGNNLTRPSLIELEAAEIFVDLIPSVDMVKFTKNGSTATTAAVKLARAYTGRELVARCANHPFFSYDDWFIGSTPLTKGIPEETISKTKTFFYNDIASLEHLLQEYPHQFACVILEPATTELPGEDFLKRVQSVCRKNGIVFILDEMITGFRWHLRGAQQYFGLDPDLCTFGKAMANGFSVAAVAGKRDIMQLGSIEFEGKERVFLLSTTHGAEMCGLGAFVETVKFMKENPVVEHYWSYGEKLVRAMNEAATAAGVAKYFQAGGYPCSPAFTTFDITGYPSLEFRTLFMQEMAEQGIMMPWVALCYRHTAKEFERTKAAIEQSLKVYKKALEDGVAPFLRSPAVKPVFRKYN